MITLKRLNDDEFVLNAVLIEQVQSLPDTTISLINGKKIVVKNKADDVIQKITEYYQQIGLARVQIKAGEEDE
ncbi:flagellar FlbD family protein [Oceanobacillus profundus]|uniref:Flagellar protein FlbD n=1 Tax=Oceanobacillus profundus TaxID=372463 RepID=A0A417YJZ8_9BACI|nr:flagellar FlbD family protein [Oceanobacillus profundus]MBR3121573.1 flagellar FlbD family protein [Oceanobacillus sp.]PAE30038.1 flagellar protein FlbD [Paenibacillus sp. 7884-2]MCM3396359.1 flagellar FlbD family protein [Oceanobacillus profundus]MDO6449631.1 flagellar FlbD family protein [Oceanobacillus profundus]RHW33635.1 flagellar protein FlbD [Oceanobacillus profundus]